MVRCFIGIILPEGLKARVVDLQNRIKLFSPECKFVEEENLHVTLSFLGELDDEAAKNVADKLDSICSRFEKFQAVVEDFLFIPNERFIRVLALDVKSETISALSNAISSSIGGDVKPPHLTLCRVKDLTKPSEFVRKIKSLSSDAGTFTVGSIQLMKSVLSRAGPAYSIIHESKLS
jgi:2'-5' RNA ligase